MILVPNNTMMQTYLLITRRADCEVFNDLQVWLDVQWVGCVFTATQLQDTLKQTVAEIYRGYIIITICYNQSNKKYGRYNKSLKTLKKYFSYSCP